jgi:hypothetical protein
MLTGPKRQEAEAGSWFMVLEACMEARSWMLEAGKTLCKYSLYPVSSIQYPRPVFLFTINH